MGVSDAEENVPAGWYPAPQGGKRYWDGKRWLALPDPDAQPGKSSTDDTPVTEGSPANRKKTIIVSSVVAAVVLIAAAVGGLIWKDSHDTDIRNASIASSESSKAAAAKAASDAEAARIQRDIAAKRAAREVTVTGIAASVKTLAEDQVQKGLFTGPILSVTCDPVGGGSTDDLSAKTTVFECFAAVKDNGDGTLSGRKYHATMNWDTGNYTYGLGPAK